MPSHSRLAIFIRVVLLPLGLVLATVMGLGSYNETSDDTTLAWLFSGVLALKPVSSLPLYYHGYGHVLAAAYTALPNVPWFGLLNAALLAGATVLTFAVIDKTLRHHLRPGVLLLALLVFYGVAWVEHWLWFSHVRVGIVFAGASVLFAAQRPTSRSALLLGVAGVLAAWLQRPSLALLGFGAAVPAAALLAGSWRRVAPLLGTAALTLALATGGLALLQNPAAARMQAMDKHLARVLDFGQLRPYPLTATDSLGTAAVALWMMGDAELVNEGLMQRAYHYEPRDFISYEVPDKLRTRLLQVVRDYFPLLILLAATAAEMLRRQRQLGNFWLVQIVFAGALFLLAAVFKLPPRIALPLLDLWVIANLIFVFGNGDFSSGTQAETSASVAAQSNAFKRPFSRAIRYSIWVLGAVVLALYAAKTLHRHNVLKQEQNIHELALEQISQRTAGSIRVMAGTNDLLKSLSPFRRYNVGPGPVLVLTGWPSHDPSQARLRQHLSGASDQAAALLYLAQTTRATQWVLTAENAQWLNRRFLLQTGAAPRIILRAQTSLLADTSLHFYRPVSQ